MQETFQTMLSLAVVLQLVPFLYLFGALILFGLRYEHGEGVYGRTTLLLAGVSGLLTTTLGILLVFFPSQSITSLKLYEIKMVGGTALFIGLAWFFFFI